MGLKRGKLGLPGGGVGGVGGGVGGIEPGQLVVTRGNERLRPGAVVSFQIPSP
jgi:hypothetical protein